MKYTAKQIKQISEGSPSEIAQFITTLLVHVEKLEARVKELERQIGSNSNNSSKPPSCDGFRKPKSPRPSGGKKGAPKGHNGLTLKMADNPDEIKWHKPDTCLHCHYSLAEVPIESYKRRQVVDLPLPRLIFTEHRVATMCCPNCNKTQQAVFQENVKAPIQYGDSWNAWCAYLNTYQHLPLERISQLFGDLTGHRPSEATLLSHLEKLSIQLEPIERVIKQKLVDSQLVHADETGMRIEGKLQWLHTVCNDRWTLYNIHHKRGKEAINASKSYLAIRE